MGNWNPPGIWGWVEGMKIPVTDSFGNVVGWAWPDEGSSSSFGWVISLAIMLTLFGLFVFVAVPLICIWNGFLSLLRLQIFRALGYFSVPVLYLALFLLTSNFERIEEFTDRSLNCIKVQAWATEDNIIYISTSKPRQVGISINNSDPIRYPLGTKGKETIGIRVEGELHSAKFVWVRNTPIGWSGMETCNQTLVSEGKIINESALRPSLQTIWNSIKRFNIKTLWIYIRLSVRSSFGI
jgi:hypothetical protein